MSEIEEHYIIHTGMLGNRVHEERTCPDGVGRYQTFERGSIHYHPDTGAFETHGAIRDVWAGEKWENGWLGYPVTDEQELNIMELFPISDDGCTFYSDIGRISYFQNGAIFWIRETNECGCRKRPNGDSNNSARNWPPPEKMPWWKIW